MARKHLRMTPQRFISTTRNANNCAIPTPISPPPPPARSPACTPTFYGQAGTLPAAWTRAWRTPLALSTGGRVGGYLDSAIKRLREPSRWAAGRMVAFVSALWRHVKAGRAGMVGLFVAGYVSRAVWFSVSRRRRDTTTPHATMVRACCNGGSVHLTARERTRSSAATALLLFML